MSDFKNLNLSTNILNSLQKKGYTTPTQIQKEAIPHLLEGRDLLGIAQTGTGKTAAFSLPILDNLTKSKNPVRANNIRALILTPTRELASQIIDNIERYGNGLGLRYQVLYGGVNINTQIKAMQKGVDIVVATPGRLLDLMNQGHVRLSQIEIFVLDEADRMLDMGFIHDIKKIIAKLPRVRQNLFFSATMPENIAKFAHEILVNPVKVEVTPQSTTVEKIDQRVNFVDKGNKPLLLKSILEQEDAKTVLVFSKTKHGANKIVQYLENEKIASAAIHGNKSQVVRERALEDFRKGKVKVLIATDIAARGIDVPNISHVINYDVPNDPESYVHRIGRTARAGRNGIAITFCDSSELNLLKSVEKTIKYTIPKDDDHSFHGVRATVNPLNALKKKKPQSGEKSGYGHRASSEKGKPEAKSENKQHLRARFGAKKKKPRFGENSRESQPYKFGTKKKY